MNDRQRLEAIVAVVCKYLPPDGISREEAMSQIIGLVDPLPEQPEQEPVAWIHRIIKDGELLATHVTQKPPEKYEKWWTSYPLYAAPPSKPWVSLTDEEIKGILDCGRGGLVDIKKAEQILKEKNAISKALAKHKEQA